MSTRYEQFTARINEASRLFERGNLREAAKLVLEDVDVLNLENISKYTYEGMAANFRCKAIRQCLAEEGFFVDLFLRKDTQLDQGLPEFKNASEILKWMLSRAETEIEVYDGAIQACAEILQDGSQSMGLVLSEWLAQVLLGNTVRPRVKKGPNTDKYEARDSQICLAVDALIETGFEQTRNNASQPVSACDYVAEALQKMGGLNITYEAVAKIYQNGLKREKESEKLTDSRFIQSIT